VARKLIEFFFLISKLPFYRRFAWHLYFFCYKLQYSKTKTIMSEETKTPEGDYVMMGSGESAPGSTILKMPGLDDPNLSQEDKDHRLAIALQQQENAAAYDAHKKKHEEYVKASTMRTARSGTFTRLAAVRDKDHGMLSVPADYTTDNAYVKSDNDYVAHTSGDNVEENFAGMTPQQIADYKLAKELQKVEQVGAGTVQEMNKIVTDEVSEAEAQAHRTERSNFHINQKGFRHGR
jgi:hypothetical protein